MSRSVSCRVLVLTAVVVAVGVAAFVYGGADDSPGLQLIGAVLTLGALALAVRSFRRVRRGPANR
jgi:membrane protein implicated in regulation of membrane protease activity